MDVVKPPTCVKIINRIAIFFSILTVPISVRGDDIGTFTYLSEKDRKNCVKMFNNGDLKYDKVADIYFKEKETPLSGMQKQYVCNKPNQTKSAFSNLVNTMNNLEDYKTIEGKNNQRQQNGRILLRQVIQKKIIKIQVSLEVQLRFWVLELVKINQIFS